MRPHNDEGDPVFTDAELQRVVGAMADLSGRLTCNELANTVGVSERYFTGMFRRSFGMSLHRWVTRQRCMKAAELLVGSSLPVPEIAVHVGFCSQSHLTYVFRKTLGITPATYRRNVARYEALLTSLPPFHSCSGFSPAAEPGR